MAAATDETCEALSTTTSDAGTSADAPLPARPRAVPDRETRIRLALDHHVDERSILKECERPGSVRGMAGERTRKALAAWRGSRRRGGR
jgi:hypothetical protein